MKFIADALIPLPFTLDFCARGPDVEPLVCTLNGLDATLFFPPSLSDGTDGAGDFWGVGLVDRTHPAPCSGAPDDR